MKIYINEKSFNVIAKSEDEAYQALEVMIKTAQALRTPSNRGQIYRHRNLKDHKILKDRSLIQYLHDLSKSNDPNKRNMTLAFLTLFAKSPFLESTHTTTDSITDTNSNCLKETCFDTASACCCGAAVISLSLDDNFSEGTIILESSIYGKKEILNYRYPVEVEKDTWIYESNPKHDLHENIVVDGETHSAMLLDNRAAQSVLTNGIKVGKSVFGAKEGIWYKFNCHHANIYHGFPVDEKIMKTKDFKFADKFHNTHGQNNYGQIFEHHCCTCRPCKKTSK